MRITSTTSSPVITNDRTAAGPAALMTTPLPTKRPAPMTPPRAIMVMCRCLRPWRSPLACGRVLFVRLVLTVTGNLVLDENSHGRGHVATKRRADSFHKYHRKETKLGCHRGRKGDSPCLLQFHEGSSGPAMRLLIVEDDNKTARALESGL